MSAEKLAPCPVCGGECYLNINCNITCDSYDCDYEVNENIHAELSAALVFYRAHKDRRCETCGWYENCYCNWNSFAVGKCDWYCADWTAKSV